MPVSYVYILLCRDGSLYTGWTTNIDKRLAQHQAGKGGRYTRSRLPVVLVYQEELASPAKARQREWAVKQLSREEKMALVKKGQ